MIAQPIKAHDEAAAMRLSLWRDGRVLVIDRPFRFATVELEEMGETHEASFWSAIRQMDAIDVAIFDAIAVARPDAIYDDEAGKE